MNRDEYVFAGALAVPRSERPSFLDRQCDGDAVLRARVEALLEVHEQAPHFLEVPLSSRHAVGVEEKAGDVIGGYTLIEKIGEGGCGVVWLADQGEPVRRRVALKIIKLGMDTKSVVARFEVERQALALMDHPSIAKVHDAGSTTTGRPFFAMELVRGSPITTYCDENHLNPAARLELFIKVCHAVNHAHQKGIIHRDLKPSNLLVAVHDGVPTPKVIDFGIAKATQGRLTDATVFTAVEQFIGTPAYMSPEQTEMGSPDVDTRSDIYALGVLLYELMTGHPPFEAKTLLQSGVDQVRRHIREVEPPRPSRRFNTLAENERTRLARLRDTTPAQLSVLLRGDLDWIIMRCLEKDRTRRYDTVNGLALDLRRHLGNEPVVARPPSTAYLLRKLIRRHRFGFAAGVAIVFTLAAGVIVSGWLAVQARQAGDRAETARWAEARLRQEAEKARQVESQLRHDAQRQESVARQRAYAADMNLVLQALAVPDPDRARQLLYRHKPGPGESDLRGWEWRYLWQFCQPEWESVLCDHGATIRSMSVSGDGRFLAVAGGRLSVWNLRTRTELPTPFYGTDCWRVAFAPGVPLLAAYFPKTSSSPDRIAVWNLETRETVQEISLPGACGGFRFSEDSSTLAGAIAAPDDKIVVWSVADGRVLRAIPAAQRQESGSTPRTAFAVTRDLGIAAHITPEGLLRVVDLNTAGELWVKAGADDGSIAGTIAFSPDGRLMASSAFFSDLSIRIWDTVSGELLQRLQGHRGPVFSLRFWPDGRTLASASNDRTIRIWDVATGKEQAMLRGHKPAVSHLELLSDPATLISGATDGAVCLWNAQARKPREAWVQLPERIGAWRFAEDVKSLLTAAGDGRIIRWQGDGFREKAFEFSVGRIVADWRMGPEQFSPDLRYVAFRRLDAEGKIEVWDANNRRLHQTFDARVDIHPVAYFRDRDTVRIFDREPNGGDSIRCGEWYLASGRLTRSWTIPIGSLPPSARSAAAVQLPSGNIAALFLAAAFSGDGERCLMSTPSGRSVVYDFRTSTGEFVDVMVERFPQFSPDGRLLAGREHSEIKLREMAGFREVARLPTVMRMPQSVAFFPDGSRLAVGSAGNEAIMLWNPLTRDPLLTLEANGAQFVRTAFSPDGNRLGARDMFLPGGDGRLYIWSAPTWQEIEAAEKRASRGLDPAP